MSVPSSRSAFARSSASLQITFCAWGFAFTERFWNIRAQERRERALEL